MTSSVQDLNINFCEGIRCPKCTRQGGGGKKP